MRFGRLINLGALDQRDDLDALDAGGEQPRDRSGDQGGQEDPLKHGRGGQWQGKAKACLASWAALWMVMGLANPTPQTTATPSRMASKAGRRTSVTGAALFEAASVLIIGNPNPYRPNGLRS
jgi:hypothetical protein